MKSESTGSRIANYVLIGLLLIITLFTAYKEHYFDEGILSRIPLTLWFSILGGFLLTIWLGWGISTRRLLSLILVILILEYIKETIGTRLELWKYTAPGGSFLFGVWLWVFAGLATYTIATRVVIRLTKKWWFSVPRLLNPLVMIAVFALIPLTLCDYWPKVDGAPDLNWCNEKNLFWVFYGLLFLAGVVTSLLMDLRTLAGIFISTWIVGTISESVGASSEIWVFLSKETLGPPAFLIFGCWTLEILGQYSLSAVLAGEPLDEVAQSDDPPSGDPSPNDPTSRKGPAGNDPASTGETGAGIRLTSEERVLRTFMRISALIYFVLGLIFVFRPDLVFLGIDFVAKHIPGMDVNLGVKPSLHAKFWLSMTFSMMMTITVLCFLAQHNIRKNKGYIVPLLVAKSASAVSGLCFFILGPKYFAYLVLFVVDGALFWTTLHFYIHANRAFLEAQTVYFRRKLDGVNQTPETKVASFKGEDKFDLLDRVLAETEFFEILEKRFEEVHEGNGKSREEFSVVIKPNFMFAHSGRDITTYTDPALVEGLIDRIAEKGFSNICVVEAQSTIGNYYDNRDVLSVALHVGYSVDKNYRIVDLTEEMVPYDYGGRLGKHYVGPTWRDADFRLSFAKNKTHTFATYTLTLKNVYGTLPLQDKLKVYHAEMEYDWPTIETMKHFPVHFGLIDAFYSGDGQFGVMCDPYPNPTKTIIGGKNLMAVDWVGATKMGLAPYDVRVGRFLYLAVEAFGKPRVDWVGDRSVYRPWENVHGLVVRSLDLIEEGYHFSNWSFSILSACDKAFPFRISSAHVLFLRWLFKPIKRYYYRYDAL